MKISMLNPTPLEVFRQVEGQTGVNTDNNIIKSFAQLFQEKLAQVESIQQEADALTESFLVGEPVELHQVMLAMEKADLALQLTVQIKNKLVEAYKEISHMQV